MRKILLTCSNDQLQLGRVQMGWLSRTPAPQQGISVEAVHGSPVARPAPWVIGDRGLGLYNAAAKEKAVEDDRGHHRVR